MTVTRQLAGTPVGGQFAASARTEPAVQLSGSITAEDIERYTNRHCGELAWSLHQATGWPLIASVDGYDEATDRYGWNHMGVIRPDGMVLDVEGPHDLGDWADQWAEWAEDPDESYALPVDDPNRFHLDATTFPPHDAADADRVAALVLAEHPTPAAAA